MTKPRTPTTVEAALVKTAGQFPEGYVSLGKIINRHPATIRAWGDPDKEDDVPFGAAIEMTLAYIAQGGEGAPLFEAFGAKLDLAHARRFADAKRLHDYAGPLVKEAGEAHAAIISAARPSATAPDFDIAFKEALENYEKLLDILPFLAAQAGKSHLLPRYIPGAGSEQPTDQAENEGDLTMAQAP